MLGNLDAMIDILDCMLDTPRKRHIAGGILISFALLFGGLAITAITVREEKIND